MQYIAQSSYVEEILSKFFKPPRVQYYDDNLNYYLNTYEQIQHQQLTINNRHNQKIIASLFTFKQSITTTCIIYMHGFGSNRFEALNILNVLTQNYALCSFDFSGSGRSEGTHVTYGNKQKYDIEAVLKYLAFKGYTSFVLWGRSMGATSAILYTAMQKSSGVFLQILDSPFCTFENVAMELASKKVKLPGFAMNILLDLTRKHCASFQHNPFEVDAKDIKFSEVPSLFVYSKGDSVISCQNSENIIKHCTAKYEKLIIDENHNAARRLDTLQKIFLLLQKYRTIFNKRSSRSSLSVSKKKGIEVIANGSSFDNYGIWVSMKFKNAPKIIQSVISISNRGSLSTKSSFQNIGKQEKQTFRKKHSRMLSHDKYL